MGFDPSTVHAGFVADEMRLGQVFLRELPFSPVSITPVMLHSHSLIHSFTTDAK